MAANWLLATLLLCVLTINPSYTATFQAARLWETLFSTRSHSDSADSSGAGPYRVVSAENYSVIYEHFNQSSTSSVHVASFSDPLHKLPASFRLVLESDVDAAISFHCRDSDSELTVISNVVGEAPKLYLTFDHATSTAYISVIKRSSAESSADISILVKPGQILVGSVVTLQKKSNQVAHYGSECSTQSHVAVEYSSNADSLCSARHTPCDHTCDEKTGECACHAGYAVDEKNAERCHATHQVVFAVPGIEKKPSYFNITATEFEMLLEEHIKQSIGNAVHRVAMTTNTVTVTTKDSDEVSAEEAAHRLRRDVATDTLQGRHLGLSSESEIVVSAPAGLHIRGKRQTTCTTLGDILRRLLPASAPDPCQIMLLTDADICSVCVPPPISGVENGKFKVSIPLPDTFVTSMVPGNLQVRNAHLNVELTVTTRALRVELTGVLVFGNAMPAVTIIFDTASGSAIVSGGTTTGISVSDILSIFSSSLAGSVGLSSVRADSASFQLELARDQPIIYYIRLGISSASDLARNLIGSAGLPTGEIQSVLEAANLDSFDITDVEFLVSNADGQVCAEVSGRPILPQLSGFPPISVEIKGCGLGTTGRTVKYGFSINGSINIADAIKGFLPSVDISGIPGISGLQLPEFSLSVLKPPLPGRPNFPNLPNFSAKLPNLRPRLPRLRLPSLNAPGVNFLALFRPGKIGVPDILSIGGGLGLGPLCLDFKNGEEGPAARLSSITDVVFPTLSIGQLPAPFEALLDVEIRELCLNRSAKLFTAEVAWPSRIDLVPSKPGLIYVENTVVRTVINAASRPIKFDFSARSSSSLGLDFVFEKKQNGDFVFTGRQPSGAAVSGRQLPTLLRVPELSTAIDTLQLNDLMLSNFEFSVSRQPNLMFRVMATVSYRQLPMVIFELVVSRPFTSSATVAGGIQTSSSTLANIVSSVAPSVDISDVPVVGDITVPSTSCVYVNATLPATLNIPFVTPDLKTLASGRLTKKLSFLFPVTFPRVGRKNFVAALGQANIDIQSPDREISLKDMLQLAVPGINLDELTPPAGLPALDNIFIDQLQVNLLKKQFCVAARVAGITFDIIPNFLSVTNIEFVACMSKTGRTTNRNLAISGEFTIGSTTAQAMVESKRGLLTVSAFIFDPVSVTDILTKFGATFIPGGDGLASTLKSNGFDSFSMSNIVLVVNKTSSETIMSISASATLPGFSAELELLFTGLGTSTPRTVAVFAIPRIGVANIVSKLSGIDLNGIPVLEDLTVPSMAITLASNTLRLPTNFRFSSSLVRGGASIAKGVAANYLQEIGGSLRNFQLNFRPGSFDINLESLPNLNEALQLLIPDTISTDAFKALPSLVPGVGGLRVTRIAYDATLKKFTVEVSLSSLSIIPNLLEVDSAKLKVSYTKSSNTPSRSASAAQRKSSVAVAIEGDATLFALTLRITASFDTARKAFAIRLTSPSDVIGFRKLFELLGSAANDLTNPAISALRLKDSSITNPLFEVNAQSKAVAFRIRGTPTIAGFGIFTAEVLVNTAPRQYVLTLSAERFSISKLIETVTGLDLSGIPFLGLLNGPSAVGVTLSATNIDRIPFPILSYPLNETTSIDRGLGFTVAFRLPQDCAGDPICNFVQLLLGNQAIIFRVTGINGPQATLAYRIPKELSLGSFRLYNVDFGFSLSATRPPTVGLTNIELDIPVPFPAEGQKPLHFRGKMLVDPTLNVEARLQMIGIYINAFGIPILSFGNVDAGFRSRIDCPICVTQLRLGGEVAIGQRCYTGNKANCVIAQGLFQIDAVDVKENFYYFAANQLSYRALLRAVGIPDFPGLQILDAVSIKNLEASYSAIDRNIPSGILPGGKTIKAGMVFKGVFSVLFLVNVKVDVQVELLFGVPKSVNALVAVDPINLGPLKFTAASDPSKGAKFELKASLLPPSFYFSVDGSLSIDIIGFKASVLAKIDSSGLDLQANGPIFGFPASFKLVAQFQDIKNPTSFKNFAMAGTFTNLGSSIINGVRNALNAAKARIDRELRRLTDAAGSAQQALNGALGQLNLKKQIEAQRKRAFNDARNALNAAQRKVNSLCSIRNCNTKKSVPKPCIKQSCSCSIKYPCCSRWRCSICCRTICVPYPSTCGYHDIPFIDPACTAQNAYCAPLRGAAFLGLEGAKGTLRGAEAAVKAAEAATAAATSAWNRADVLNRAAQGAVAPVRALFNGLNSLLGNLLAQFQIHSVGFKVQVESVSDATIGVSIDLTVTGNRHRLSANLNLRDIAGYALSLARRFFGGFF